jgi:hypothetical protein
MAREMRLTPLVAAHLNKGAEVARHRITGSAAWVNVPRSVLIMGPPPGEDALETSERLCVVVKANLLPGKMPDAMSLRLTPGREDPTVAVIAWTGEQAGVRASDLTTNLNADERREREDCADAIRDLLADGPRPAQECEETLKKAGYTKTAIRRARESLFITRKAKTIYQDVFRGPHIWKLPLDADAHARVSIHGTPVGQGGHLSATDDPQHTQMTTNKPRARGASEDRHWLDDPDGGGEA